MKKNIEQLENELQLMFIEFMVKEKGIAISDIDIMNPSSAIQQEFYDYVLEHGTPEQKDFSVSSFLEYELEEAVISGNLDKVAYLIDDKGANVNFGLEQTPTRPLIWHALENSDFSMMKLLLDKGAIYDFAIETGSKLIEYALNKPEALKLLIDAGANVNALGNFEEPIIFTSLYRNLEAFKLLIQSGANKNAIDKFGAKLIFTALNQNFEAFKFLIESGADKNTVDQYNDPLIFQALGSNTKAFNFLVQKDANIINSLDANGYNLLDAAIQGKKFDSALMLIQKGLTLQDNKVSAYAIKIFNYEFIKHLAAKIDTDDSKNSPWKLQADFIFFNKLKMAGVENHWRPSDNETEFKALISKISDFYVANFHLVNQISKGFGDENTGESSAFGNLPLEICNKIFEHSDTSDHLTDSPNFDGFINDCLGIISFV
ncbi:MAG: uncharacterized protein K0R02_146 [Rickettsiaceae bacterium]|jgi:ankyrin repeat protein|nr:uncharacterized protein [Rickettsiaceae bacterium]